MQECKRICSIEHAHIVKVLGLCLVPNQLFPLLVMELMDDSLHHCLESHQHMPLVLKIAILEDIAKGLLFMHTQSPEPIVHRDLTARNVLLTSSLVAKVTDIGNSSFAELATKHDGGVDYPPGVKVYMPPEYEDRKFLPSLDVFSYGHLTMFVVTQVGVVSVVGVVRVGGSCCDYKKSEWVLVVCYEWV